MVHPPRSYIRFNNDAQRSLSLTIDEPIDQVGCHQQRLFVQLKESRKITGRPGRSQLQCESNCRIGALLVRQRFQNRGVI